MDTDRLTDLLVALHEGLPRLGPGNAESTLRALSLCEDLPAAPEVLDLGCGTGAQTLVLASAIDGHITAVDLFGQFLAQLDRAAAEQGLEGRIRTRQADMRDPPFPDGSFDLIWSEGAVYVMGFDQALTRWRPLARPGGYLVVSELSWFRPDPPAEVKEFWDLNYPAMRGVDANLAAALAAGWVGARGKLPPACRGVDPGLLWAPAGAPPRLPQGPCRGPGCPVGGGHDRAGNGHHGPIL